MNTRLQVEHPVTELTTGLDLVELMIRSAAGEKLPIKQNDVGINGWAVETRIYAEDPYRGFLPSTGRLVRYQPPKEATRDGVTVRNDTGVYEGGEISIYYDPMIAKLCTHAPDRAQATAAMGEALDEFRIDGINHNIDFLDAIMHNSSFREGRLTTAFIAEEYPNGFHGRALDDDRARRFVAAALIVKLGRTTRASQISGTLNGRHQSAEEMVVILGERSYSVALAAFHHGKLYAEINGVPYTARSDWTPGETSVRLREGEAEHTFQLVRLAGGYRLSQGGTRAVVIVRSTEAAKLAELMKSKATTANAKALLCPMPGLVVSVNVKEGQDVKAGEPLAVVEAMKMENVLTAERDATVKCIKAKKGDSLALDDVILEFA
jgi:propionyl-CoA carboxylase alpha chain